MRIAAANFAFQTLSALKEYGRTGATNLVEDHWLAPHPLWDQDHNLKAVFSKVSKIMVEEKGVPKETADEICQRAATYCKRRPRPIVFFAFAVSRRVEADGCRELVRDYETRSL